MARTTMISSSVNARSRFMARRRRTGSVGNVVVLALAAILAVGAKRDEIVGLPLTGHGEAIVVAPRVLEVGVFGIGSAPLVHAPGLPHQRLQVLRILADFEL